MIRIFESAKFVKDARGLPKSEQTKLASLLVLLQNNPFDSRLHTKPLSEPLHGLFSFRIARDWRALFKFLGPREILLLRVRHRKDIYR